MEQIRGKKEKNRKIKEKFKLKGAIKAKRYLKNKGNWIQKE
jgi:hypothetical protein